MQKGPRLSAEPLRVCAGCYLTTTLIVVIDDPAVVVPPKVALNV